MNIELPSVKNQKSPVIVLSSFGNYHVYPATIEFAKQILQEKIDDLGDSFLGVGVLNMRKAFKDHPEDLTIPYLVSDVVVLSAMTDILDNEIGEESRALYRIATVGTLEKDMHPFGWARDAKLVVTKDIQDELVLWAFKNKIDVKTASASELEKTQPEQSLSFMAGVVSRANGHPIKYVYDTIMDDANELQVLLHGAWKPAAKIENVVQRYLTLVNSYCHRDEKYHIGVMEIPGESV